MRTGRIAAIAVVVTVAIMPAVAGAGSTREAAQPPDVWSGSWPSQLMPGEVQLGTLTWRPIRYEEGMALVGLPFGGRPFEGCPTDGVTRFFRGKYVRGGYLVACTIGADGKRLIGRFDGNELFRSGSFDIELLLEEPKPFFFGTYSEDAGIVTDWCGILEKGFSGASSPDVLPPSVSVSAGTARRGVVPLRFSVFGGDGAVTVDVTVRRGSRVVHRSTQTARPNGAESTVRWRAPQGARGRYTFCAAARDTTGRTSRACAPLRL